MDVEISKPLSVISSVLGTKLSTTECIQENGNMYQKAKHKVFGA